MYSEYTICTLHTQYATYACFLYIVYTLYNVHTDSQSYFDKYKMCAQNKCALCTLYTVVCTYSIHIASVDILYVISRAIFLALKNTFVSCDHHVTSTL